VKGRAADKFPALYSIPCFDVRGYAALAFSYSLIKIWWINPIAARPPRKYKRTGPWVLAYDCLVHAT